MEREKSQQYQRPYYPQDQLNKPKASSSKNDGWVPFKRFINATWEENMKNKEVQKYVNDLPNTLPSLRMIQIASYYYPICEMPHNLEQCGIYLNQMEEKEKVVAEEEPKVNCIWIIHDENSELIFQKDMDTTQNFLIQNTIGSNPYIIKMK